LAFRGPFSVPPQVGACFLLAAPGLGTERFWPREGSIGQDLAPSESGAGSRVLREAGTTGKRPTRRIGDPELGAFALGHPAWSSLAVIGLPVPRPGPSDAAGPTYAQVASGWKVCGVDKARPPGGEATLSLPKRRSRPLPLSLGSAERERD
jgi:hypothetical protein